MGISKDDLADYSQGEEGGVEWKEGFDTEESARSSFKDRNQQGCPFFTIKKCTKLDLSKQLGNLQNKLNLYCLII